MEMPIEPLRNLPMNEFATFLPFTDSREADNMYQSIIQIFRASQTSTIIRCDYGADENFINC